MAILDAWKVLVGAGYYVVYSQLLAVGKIWVSFDDVLGVMGRGGESKPLSRL